MFVFAIWLIVIIINDDIWTSGCTENIFNLFYFVS